MTTEANHNQAANLQRDVDGQTALTIIAARAANGVIGRNNSLCWYLPEDLARFKRLTAGHTVIMGRKTWESLPAGVRPLPGRQNIVVTRQPGYEAVGAQCAASLLDAIQLAASRQVFVIGGAQLYVEALPLADVLELTEVSLAPAGDTWFPVIDDSQWEITHCERAVSMQDISFAFVRYNRKR